MRNACRLVLEQTDWTSQLLVLLCVAHVAHLMGQQVSIRIHGLHSSYHHAKFLTDYGLRHQWFAKYLSLRSPLKTFLCYNACPSDDTHGDDPPLMVEIRHDHFESRPFLSHKIRDWHLHIFKRDICCTCCA